jgi:uncharacterized membrane protein YdjX (TVP38/TMEM64 family)
MAVNGEGAAGVVGKAVCGYNAQPMEPRDVVAKPAERTPGQDVTAPGTRGQGSALRPKGRKRKALIRLVLVLVVLAVATASARFVPVREWLRDPGHITIPPQVTQALAWLGFWVYPVSTFVIAVLVAAGVPRLAFCILGGFIFGFWPALLINEVATVLAYYWVFLFVRWGGRDLVMRRWPKLQRWTGFVDKQGTMGVVLVRQLPIHGTVINLCLGLSHLKHRQFLVGTAMGVIPEAIPTTLLGVSIAAGTKNASLQGSAVYIVLAVGVFALVWIGGRYLMKRMKGTSEGAALIEEAASLADGGEEDDQGKR